MTDQRTLPKRVGQMLRNGIGVVLDEMSRAPIPFAVVVCATAISYNSLRHVAEGTGLAPWAAFLFPLTLDVAAYPALRIAMSGLYNGWQRCFGLLIGSAALVGSIYGNLADHLGWARPGLDAFGNRLASTEAIYFVSITPPLTIGCTLLLTLFVPRASTSVRKASRRRDERQAPPAQPVTPELTPPVGRPSSLHIVKSIDEKVDWCIHEHDRSGKLPEPRDVDAHFGDKSRNGHRAVSKARKRLEARGDAVDRAL